MKTFLLLFLLVFPPVLRVDNEIILELEVEAYQNNFPVIGSGGGLVIIAEVRDINAASIPEHFEITKVLVECGDSLWVTNFTVPSIRLSNKWLQRTVGKGPNGWNKWVNVAAEVYDSKNGVKYYLGVECVRVSEVW